MHCSNCSSEKLTPADDKINIKYSSSQEIWESIVEYVCDKCQKVTQNKETVHITPAAL